MTRKPSYEELEQRIRFLELETHSRSRSEKLNHTLLTISKAVNIISSPFEFFQKVHSALSPVIDTTNFFISLYDSETDCLTFPYFADSMDDFYPPAIEISKTASLTAEVIRTMAPLLITKKEVLAKWSKSTLAIPPCTPSEIWLGVPLRFKGKMLGVMTVQHYHDPHCYDQVDVELMVSVAELVAIAIENMKVEESLRLSENKFRGIFNFAVSGILLCSHEGIIFEANEQMCEFTGLARKDLLGKHIRELSFTRESIEKSPFRFDLLKQGLKVVAERVLVRPDGTEIDVEMQTKMMPDGTYQSICSNITERKLREKALQEAEERFRLAFFTSPDSININKMDGTYVDINRGFTELTGYSRKDVIGRSSADIKIWNKPEDRQRLIEGLLRDGQVRSLESIFVMKDGSKKTALMSANIIELRGEPHILSVTKDISLLKKTEEERYELEVKYMQSQKMEAIGTMAGGIAHDFNNMLAVIIGNAEMALLEIPKENRAIYSIKQVISASQRVKKLIKQILTFSHKTDQQLLPLRLCPVILESLNLLRSTIPTTVSIVHNVKEDDDAIMGDSTQIHQLLMNLCANAVHAMDEKGVLTITGSAIDLGTSDIAHQPDMQPGRYFKLSVCDTGVGISKEIQHRIFDPFYTTKGVHEGTGMGLSIVLGIVKGHGGFIQVDSEPGKGTGFSIYFPVFENVYIESTEEITEEFPARNERILFIDDIKMMAEVGGNMLSRLGYAVTVTSDSRDALEIFKSDPGAFDAVITDQSMPHMSGAELSVELLKIRPDIPIILCTGYSKKVTEEEATKIGVRKYLTKPYEINKLAQYLREILG